MRATRLVILWLAVTAVTALPLVPVAYAQGRRAVPRAAPRAGRVVVAAYYRPLFLSPVYHAFYDPWWYPFPYGWYPSFGYPGYAYDDTASMRLQVSPRETEVFVDGYYAGTVDDFDGMFQRLRVDPGPHEITLYLAGHRTMRQNIFVQDRGTFRFRHRMEPLAPGESSQARPAAQPRPQEQRRMPVGDPSFGAIAIRVQPADAEVFIDGERWEGPRDDEALVVQVTPGTHRIEVRKDGYRSYEAEVGVTAAETSPLNISLPKQ